MLCSVLVEIGTDSNNVGPVVNSFNGFQVDFLAG